MIKVIASDMDGTLLANDGKIKEKTLTSMYKAMKAGIRFILVTGRGPNGVAQALNYEEFQCDRVLWGGAAVSNFNNEIILQKVLSFDICQKVFEILRQYPVCVRFSSYPQDYFVGDEEEIQNGLLEHTRLFFVKESKERIRNTEVYKTLTNQTERLDDIRELKKKEVPIYKILVNSNQKEVLDKVERTLTEEIDRIYISSSFSDNLEITAYNARKGPVLLEYIESLGYKKEEVLVFGDSRNDFSMLSMDFGATVAMGNAEPEIKKISKYVTKTNEECGVAYVIEKIIKRKDSII